MGNAFEGCWRFVETSDVGARFADRAPYYLQGLIYIGGLSRVGHLVRPKW